MNDLYDDVGELYSARTYNSGGTENLAQRYGYQYDPAWNLNKRTNNATVRSFNVNNQNQLTSSIEGTHSYDGNGNMTESGYWGYAYDDENQMVVSLNFWPDWSTGSRTEFTYDGKMRLRKAVDYVWNSTGGTNGSWVLTGEKRYIYDGMLVVQERTAANAVSVTYTRGNDLSGTLQGAGGIGGMLARSQTFVGGLWRTHHYYHADGNGNITYLVNNTQTLGASYKYDPFGGTISSSGSYANANRYRFSSKELSVENGIYYYGYRWYHPNLQRWLNRDPLEDGTKWVRTNPKYRKFVRTLGMKIPIIEMFQGSNLSAFVRNVPLLRYDSFGLAYGNPISGPTGPVSPADPYSPGFPYYPNGPQYDPSGSKTCLQQLASVVAMLMGNAGAPGFPTSIGDDSLQHCMTSCQLTRSCDGFAAWLFGNFKEANDYLHGGNVNDIAKDLLANSVGRRGANCPESCESYCNQYRGDY